MTKWTVEVDDPDASPNSSRAHSTPRAAAGRPVVVALPKDVLSERVTVADAPPFEPVETSPGFEEMDRLRDLLAESKNPLFVLGGSRWTDQRAARFTSSPTEPDCRSQPAIAARRCSIRFIRCMPATSASAPIRSWSRAPKRPIFWCWSAAVSARSRRRAIRFFPARHLRPNCPHPSRRRRNRPGLSAASRDPCLAEPLCRGPQSPGHHGNPRGAKMPMPLMPIFCLDRHSHASARRCQPRRDHDLASRSCADRHHIV